MSLFYLLDVDLFYLNRVHVISNAFCEAHRFFSVTNFHFLAANFNINDLLKRCFFLFMEGRSLSVVD